MYRVVIAGSRDFKNYEILKEAMDQLLRDLITDGEDIVIISGTASGADRLGERYAKEKGFQLRRFPVDWNRYGKSAGYRRNVEMADHADAAVVFWDGQSKGSKHMLKISKI